MTHRVESQVEQVRSGASVRINVKVYIGGETTNLSNYHLSMYLCSETVPLRKRQDANVVILFDSERDEYDQECWTSRLCSLHSWTGWICSCLIG